jgi:O-antigen ligase
MSGAEALALEEAVPALADRGGQWGRLAYGAALAFVALLYANPMYWFPWVEKLRLGFLSMGVCAAAVLARRLADGERIRTGGPTSAPLLAYLAIFPLSLLWTIDASRTLASTAEAFKMGVVFLAVQNALDAPRRLRGFLLVAALASLGPALGGIWVWWTGDHLIEGYRTHWRGLFGDANRLAMSLVAVLPAALYGAATARRLAARLAFAAVVAAQLAAIVLTHSRSGAVATALASVLFLFRGRGAVVRGPVVAAAVLAGIALLAPQSFWTRSASIARFEEDASVEGRRHAWMVLDGIVAERPLTGVGAGGFLPAWARYAPLEAGGHRYVAHNVPLEIMGELGLPALVLFSIFVLVLLVRLWRAGDDPRVGPEARAVLAGLAGYLVCELVNGYSLSWFLYFLFACGAAAVHLASRGRAAAGAAEAA